MCVKRNVPQCALGLVVDGQPVYKNRPMLASIALCLAPFNGLVCICTSHGTFEGRSGNSVKTQVAQVWFRELCHRICVGIRKSYLLHGAGACYLVDCVAAGRRQRGMQRKNPEGIVSREGVSCDCFAHLRRLHKPHPAHTRNGKPLSLCMFYKLGPGQWSCEGRLHVEFAAGPSHTLAQGCRFAEDEKEVARRIKKQFG